MGTYQWYGCRQVELCPERGLQLKNGPGARDFKLVLPQNWRVCDCAEVHSDCRADTRTSQLSGAGADAFWMHSERASPLLLLLLLLSVELILFERQQYAQLGAE